MPLRLFGGSPKPNNAARIKRNNNRRKILSNLKNINNKNKNSMSLKELENLYRSVFGTLKY